MRYRIVVSTPYHGEMFEARGTTETLVQALEAAVASVREAEQAIREGHLPITFNVEVSP